MLGIFLYPLHLFFWVLAEPKAHNSLDWVTAWFWGSACPYLSVLGLQVWLPGWLLWVVQILTPLMMLISKHFTHRVNPALHPFSFKWDALNSSLRWDGTKPKASHMFNKHSTINWWRTCPESMMGSLKIVLFWNRIRILQNFSFFSKYVVHCILHTQKARQR